jgi:LPXTG-site transpeptidase (sortase) family protein
VRVPQIRLEADVQLSRVVNVRGGSTWEVPAFKVGHGEYSAGAGQPGNVVLLGHLTSLDAGSVFRDLHRTRPGNMVQVFSGDEAFDYVVVDVRSVPRMDLSWAQPTDVPSVSLVTCAGAWLPAIQDYALRLVVRAELIQ